MTLELRVVLIIASVLTTLLIMRKIRQSKLQIEDSIFWIGFSSMLILFSVFPKVADILAGLAGTYTTANFIYIAVIFLLIVKLFHMSIKQSQMETRLRELVQEMALAEHEKGLKKEKEVLSIAGVGDIVIHSRAAASKIKEKQNMGKITVTPCDIDGLYVIEPTVFKDERGYFVETYNQNDFKEAGLDMVFVQDNQSMSVKGVLRGLHYQKQFPQGKLVRAVRGSVFDVAVDLRTNSETYGQWFGVELTAENKKQFYIPEGFAHGFLVLSDEAEFAYKCTDFYHPGDEGGLAWNDPEIGVKWPVEEDMQLIISEKDTKWGGLKDTFKFQL